MNLVLAALVAAISINLNPPSAFGQGEDICSAPNSRRDHPELWVEDGTCQMLFALRFTVGDIGGQLSVATDELTEVKAEREDIARRLAEATAGGNDATIVQLRGLLDAATAEKSRLVERVAQLEDENSELRVKITELERKNTALVAENTGLQAQVADLQRGQQVATAPADLVPSAGSIWSTPSAPTSYASGAMPAAYQTPAVDPSAPYRTAYVGWHPEFVSPYSDVRWEDDEGCREVSNNGWTGTAAVRIEGISMFMHSPESGGYISSREAVQEPNVPIYFCSATSEPMVTVTLLRETSTGSAMWNGSRWASYTRARNPCSARFTAINPVFSYGHMAGWCSESNF